MVLQKAAELHTQHAPFVLVTIVKSLGSTPRHQGKMIVKADGSIIGTIGGGPAEARAIDEALSRLATGESGLSKYTLNKGSTQGVPAPVGAIEVHGGGSGTGSSPHSSGSVNLSSSLASKQKSYHKPTAPTGSTEVLPMECGGGMDLLFEVYGEAPIMLLIGGGHVNLEIAKLGAQLGYRVVIVDKREEFSSPHRFPMAWKCITAGDLETVFKEISLTKKDVAVIATPDHDESSLRPLLNQHLGFLGMIGSRNKVLRIKQRLLADSFPEELVDQLRAPVGLDIGAETPVEIAISVMAEIMAVVNNLTGKPLSKKFAELVVIRGGGDLATGVAHALFQSGLPVVLLEQAQPTFIRRTVSFGEAIFEGTTTVEGVTARYIEDPAEFRNTLDRGEIPILVDPNMDMVKRLKPTVLVDATLAKRNMGISKDLANRVIALGPGYTAGKDVHMVIETARGHYLGQIITSGSAQPDTGVPGVIQGHSSDRIVRAPQDGYVVDTLEIGSSVTKGDILGYIVADSKDANGSTTVAGLDASADASKSGTSAQKTPIIAPLTGVLRGMIHQGVAVRKELKIGDIDPRDNRDHIETISDKARALGGSVLQAILMKE